MVPIGLGFRALKGGGVVVGVAADGSEPRVVLSEMGLDVPAETAIRVWDSSSEGRYLVLPQRPAGTAELAEEDLIPLVTRDAMVGVAVVAGPGSR